MTKLQLTIMDAVGNEPISAADLQKQHEFPCTMNKVRSTLLLGYKAGVLEKDWIRNKLAGHYLYRKSSL